MDSVNGTNNTGVYDIATSTNGVTLNIFVLCTLYTLVKQWVNEEKIDANSTMKPDIGLNTDNDTAFMFSNADCIAYRNITNSPLYGQLANITDVSDVYDYPIGHYMMAPFFLECFFIFFFKEMDAIEKCSNPSLVYDNEADDGNFLFLDEDENGMSLLSKDQIFYSFMTHSLGLNDECEKITTSINVTDNEEAMSTQIVCQFLYYPLKLQNAGHICTGETNTLLSYDQCILYRLLPVLSGYFCNTLNSTREVENQHTDNKQTRCVMYNFVMPGIIGGSINIIGLVCNIGSLVLFRRHVIKTPTTYQLKWLACVDTILLVLYIVYVILFYVMQYLHINHDNLYRRVIWPYIQVYIWPVFCIASTSSNWLTVFIAVY